MIEVHFIDGDVESFELKNNIAESFSANNNAECYTIELLDGWVVIPQSSVKYIRYIEVNSQ